MNLTETLLGAIDILMWPSSNWQQWRKARLDRQLVEAHREAVRLKSMLEDRYRQIAEAEREGDRLEAISLDLDLEIDQLRQTLRDQGIDPDQ